MAKVWLSHLMDLPSHLKNLLHVPSITKNLLSASQFCKDNKVKFEFDDKCCLVKSQDSREVLLYGSLGHDGLYHFPTLVPTPSHPALSSSIFPTTFSNKTAVATVNAISFATWHSRLGHPSLNVLKQILQSCKIPIPNKSEFDFCSACAIGKSHKLHAPASSTVYNKPLELIYTDLWGPAPFTSLLGGYQYYISFVDAHTRYTWLYLLKSKSEATSIFQQFQKLVEKQLGCSILAVQSDWGGEFRPLSKYLAENGINHRVACPHTRHQNGVVERKHRHIVELGLTLLSQGQLPYNLWDQAFLTAVYLINRLPTAVLSFQVPFVKLLGKQPDYHFLHVFGCSCYPHLRPFNKHQMELRAAECVFLGYSTMHKGYKCLTTEGKIIISKDVTFNESSFPSSRMFSSSIEEVTQPILIPSIPLVHNSSQESSQISLASSFHQDQGVSHEESSHAVSHENLSQGQTMQEQISD